MKINAVLRCKEPEIKPHAYEVSDVITLSDAEYRSMLKEPLKDREYLAGRQGADELKAMSKGQFVVMKTGAYPMKVKLKLFFEWGISFGEPYTVKEHANRKVEYAEKKELIEKIVERYCPDLKDETEEKSKTRGGIGGQTQVESRQHFANDLRTNRPFLRTSSIKRQYPLPPTQEETDEMDEAGQKDNEPT